MTGLGWLAIGIIGGALLILGLALCMVAADSEERELRRFHPPDDDDGVSLIDDPDNQCTR